MRVTRWVALTAIGVLCVAGCTGTPQPQESEASEVEEFFEPSGEESSLRPLEDADGDIVTIADGLTVTVPAGTTREDAASQAAEGERTLLRMPDANADGLPVLQITWAPDGTGAAAGSRVHESRMLAGDAVTDYVRSSAQWPRAEDAVVATWTEQVPTDGDPVTVDCLALWVDVPGGARVGAVAFAPHGELERSSALMALRTLTIG